MSDNSSVFNPFAGLASFGVFLDQIQDYFGQELNRKTWALGALRLMAYSRPGVPKYVCDDSILHWPENQKFDLIIANPPFGVRLNQRDQYQYPEIRTVEQFLIHKGISSLKSNGKLIAVLPAGILFRGGADQRLRETLIENDLIETIISFPGGVLLNTVIPFVVLVLNKDKKLQGQVRFVDVKRFVESKGARGKVLNDYSIIAHIESNNESDVLRVVSNHKIQENNYNLDVHRYFQKDIVTEKNEHLVKLRDVMEFVRGQRGDLPVIGKLVRIRDMKDDKIDYKLDISILERTELRRPDLYQLNDSCLLLAIRWRTLKPTLFKYDGEPIFRNQDILSFKVDESILDITYLINELHSDYVQEQLEAYRMGTTIPFIRKDDLCEVVIKLPPLEEQKAKVQGIVELSDKIKILQEERNAFAHGVSGPADQTAQSLPI
jgi:type I restriction enzyme M protein